MKNFIILVSVLGFLGIVKPGMAENWSYLGGTSAGEIWYDTQSVKKVGARIFKLWKKNVMTKKAKYEMAIEVADKKYANAIMNSAYCKEEIEINCMTIEYSYLTVVFYDKDGKELLRQRYTDDPKSGESQKSYFPIGGGTSNSILYEKVCP